MKLFICSLAFQLHTHAAATGLRSLSSQRASALQPAPHLPPISAATCDTLTGKLANLIGAVGTTVREADAVEKDMKDAPTVECKVYAYVSGSGAGCSCFLE